MIYRLKMKVMFAFIIIFMLCIVGFVGANLYTGVADYNLEIINVSYQSQYKVNDTVEIQTGTLSLNGENKVADVVIETPSGICYKGKQIKLSEEGVYKVTYSAYFNDELISKTIAFNAIKTVFEVVGKGSANYGVYDFNENKSISKHPFDSSYSLDVTKSQSVNGVIVSLMPGDVFKYNKIINLKNNTDVDKIFTLKFLPSVLGEVDFQQLRIKLTDIYDENNYVTLTARDNDASDSYSYYTSFFKTAPNELPLCGDWGVEGVQRGPLAGTPLYVSFHGLPVTNKPVAQDGFSISYDYSNSSVYVIGQNLRAVQDEGKSLIADFDDFHYFEDIWSGFTTGEVFLSIEAEIYTKSSANFAITQIQGTENLTELVRVDVDAPEMIIDFAGYEETSLPKGEVGKMYRLFDASAYDLYSGTCIVEKAVYFNYYTENPINIQIADGGFVPVYSGIYTIIYSAKDDLGNKNEKKFDAIINQGSSNPINISAEKILNTEVGNVIELKKETTTGGYGNIDVVVFATHLPDNTESIVYNYLFRPLETGLYKITYKATDFIGQIGVFDYLLNVSMVDTPVFFDDIESELPRNFVSGYTYDLPELKAKDFVSNTSVETIISVSKGSINGNKFTPTQEGTVDIIYTASVGNKSVYKTYTRPVYSIDNDGALDCKKLFIPSSDVNAGYSKIGTIDYVSYEFYKNATFDFVNLLCSDLFNSSFTMLSGESSFSEMVINLTDSKNTKQSLKILFKNKAGRLYINIENNTADVYVGKTVGDNYEFSYDANAQILKCNTMKFGLKKNSCGEAFNGFESGLLTYSISFSGVKSAGVKLVIKDVCGQPLTTRTSDRINPIVSVKKNLTGIYKKGDVLTISDVIATDVISPILKSLTVTVQGPNGFVKAIDGTVLNNATFKEYKFKVEEYGMYQITYTAIDQSENRAPYISVVSVLDDNAPTVTFTNGNSTSAKVGNIKIAQISISDDVTKVENLKVYKYVKNPTGIYTEINEDVFKATEKGNYTVYYYVVDEAGNYSILSYTIKVS